MITHITMTHLDLDTITDNQYLEGIHSEFTSLKVRDHFDGIPKSFYSGLERFPNLRTLDLRFDEDLHIPLDFSFLKSMPHLENLYVTGGWGRLDGLENFSLCPLKELVLKYQFTYDDSDQHGEPASVSLDFLKGCSQLIKLVVAFMNIIPPEGEISHCQPLMHCPLLRELELWRCNLNSIDGIEACPHLISLDLPVNSVRDLRPLETCYQLEVLAIYGGNLIESLLPLAQCQKLKRVYTGYGSLTTLHPLNTIASLEEFCLCPDYRKGLPDASIVERIKDEMSEMAERGVRVRVMGPDE